jgi:hypothetical protein
MDKRIGTVQDHRRGCGWRKKGGLYLMGGGDSFECGLLPIPFGTCPCCGYGIRPSRQPTWVDADQLIYASEKECDRDADHCQSCPIYKTQHDEKFGQALLIWIGERHYPTVGHFEREAERHGTSRRIQAVPREFKVGVTWVLLAHPRAISTVPKMGEPVEFTPGIFHIFRPRRIEYICAGDESKEEIDALIERGLTPVVVERVAEAETESLWHDQ